MGDRQSHIIKLFGCMKCQKWTKVTLNQDDNNQNFKERSAIRKRLPTMCRVDCCCHVKYHLLDGFLYMGLEVDKFVGFRVQILPFTPVHC